MTRTRRLLPRWLILLPCLGFVLATASAWGWSTVENWADVLLLQMKAKQPLPALSAYGASLSLPDAYEVQRLIVRELSAQSPVVQVTTVAAPPRRNWLAVIPNAASAWR